MLIGLISSEAYKPLFMMIDEFGGYDQFFYFRTMSFLTAARSPV